MSAIKLARHYGMCLFWVVLTAGVLEADWTYEYADDFGTDKALFDSYRHSTFWSTETSPLPGPYLYYLETNRDRGLVFVGFKDQLAELGYRLPLGLAQPPRTVKGVVTIDVSFPSNADISQSPPGRLLYSVSPDGMAWSTPTPLNAGRHDIPISSAEGTCQILFSGTRVLIDNLAVSLYASAATIRVPGNLGTIQDAIDAAGNGDVIEVAPGTYSGRGNWDIEFRGKEITVRSAAGPQSTIIDCRGSDEPHRGFYFHGAEGSDSVLSGFTIRGGRVFGSEIPPDPLGWSPSPSHPIGGGIYCEFSSPTIANCVITDCAAEVGGGIGCVGDEPMIVDCIIEECSAGGLGSSQSGGRGGGIGLIGCSGATIASCTITGNSGYYNSQGAGLYCWESSAVVAGCTISNNSAPGSVQGGGAYCTGAATDITFQNCIISQNQADAGAGIFAESSASWGPRCRVSVINCTVAQNGRSLPGGGIHSARTDIFITNSIIWYNDGTSLAIVDSVSKSPVTYSNVQGGYAGTGNINEGPLFASTGLPDYHLQSTSGRYDPQRGGWVLDGVHSPCIDAGDPTASVGEEPRPNGERINMGAYGGTWQASNGSEHLIYHVDASSGRDWYNGGSRERAFRTVQKAIDAAHDGDTVLVWPGVYQEQITFMRKAITVRSAADAATITAPGGIGVSFHFAECSQSVLANFVIKGCGPAAVRCEGASPTLKNLTVVGNGFGITAYSGADPKIVNCILWGNSDGDLFQCKARYSCIEHDSPDKKAGNMKADPLFADRERGDYHLKSRRGRYVPLQDAWVTDNATSPCIDAGDPEEDYRGERLPNGERVNMGAYGGTPSASLSG